MTRRPDCSDVRAGDTVYLTRTSAIAQKSTHIRQVATAHRQALVTACQHGQARPVSAFFKANQTTAGDQGIAMDAHEPIGKLLLQRFQRFIDQHTSIGMAYGNVFLLCQQIEYLLYRYRLHTASIVRAQMGLGGAHPPPLAQRNAAHGW